MNEKNWFLDYSNGGNMWQGTHKHNHLFPHDPMMLFTGRDYSANELGYYDNLARVLRFMFVAEKIINRLMDRNLLVKDSESISLNKKGDWLNNGKCPPNNFDKEIEILAELKVSSEEVTESLLNTTLKTFALPNGLIIKADGVFVADYLQMIKELDKSIGLIQDDIIEAFQEIEDIKNNGGGGGNYDQEIEDINKNITNIFTGLQEINVTLQDYGEQITNIDNRLNELERYVFVGGHNLIAIGVNAMGSRTVDTKNSIAIGLNALEDNVFGRYNLALGNFALRHVKGIEGSTIGTRNTGIGDNTMMFSVEARSNIALGRNALATNVSPSLCVALGGSALAGYAPLDFDQETIVNNTPTTAGKQTAVGSESLQYSNGEGNTAIGERSGWQIKNGRRNTALGFETMSNADANQHYDGNEKELVSLSGTYTKSGKVFTFTVNNHKINTGDLVLISPNGIEASYKTVNSVTNVNSFSITIDVDTPNLPNSGNVNITAIVRSGTVKEGSFDNTAVGVRAMFLAKQAKYNTAIGGFALRDVEGEGNTALGYLTSVELKKGNFNTALGFGALRFFEGGEEDPLLDVNNCTGVGYNSRVSGSNQIQLGNGEVDVYTYNSIQQRSDARDKKEIRNTKLGLDFIKMLRPVDYKMNLRNGENEGNRFHHGFIAQDIRKLINENGIDFGGYQDHKINGGSDILTVSYNEIIAPLVKSVQELSEQNEFLISRLEHIENLLGMNNINEEGVQMEWQMNLLGK